MVEPVVRYRRGRDRRPEVDAFAARGLAQCVARRARVLEQPDIARELTRPPLSYPKPENWNGYIPPRLHDGQPNESPRRLALLLIMRTVEQAEKEAADALVQGR